MTEKVNAGKNINHIFLIILLFMVFNLVFSWFSSDWMKELGAVLIDEVKKKEAEEIKFANIDPLKVAHKNKFGQILVETSVAKIDPAHLAYLVDMDLETKLKFNGNLDIGSFISVTYPQTFEVQKVLINIKTDSNFKAILQTSADGIVYSAAKYVTSGLNEISLKNEKIKGLRIILTDKFKGSWSISDLKLN